MKRLTLIIALSSIAMLSYSQELGFSGFSPYSGSESDNNGQFLYNSGEILINSEHNDSYNLYNGLLNDDISTSLNKFINIKFFQDTNENGIKDEDEVFVPFGNAIINGQSFINHKVGGLELVTPIGDYELLFDNNLQRGYLLSTDASVSINIQDTNPFADILVGYSPDSNFSEYRPYITSSAFRCCTPGVNYNYCITNTGHIIEEKTAWIKIDERIANVKYNTPPDEVIDSNYVGWHMTLLPGEIKRFSFIIDVPCISDSVRVGEEFKTVAWIENGIERFEFCYDQVLRCSYDPNDKLVNPERPDSLALLDQELTYTIRFQNTGNDYAEDVVVTDTLSDLFDISTFRLINTSHPNKLVIENDKDDNYIINFRFENIFLPDSTTNLEGSNGHIMFSIRPLENLSIGTEVNNTAHIYFDFNPPIVTNTVSTIYVDKFPTVSTQDNINEIELSIYPNPTTGRVQVHRYIDKINVLSTDGRLIESYDNIKQIDLSHYTSGLYLLECHVDDQSVIKRINVIDTKK